jgi:hypothetical protein
LDSIFWDTAKKRKIVCSIAVHRFFQRWVVTLLYNIWQYLGKVTTNITVSSC